MRVLIIEDENPASQRLIRLLKEIDQSIEITDVLTSVEQSINWFSENPVSDLIFMDIQLEDGISFEIFENLEIKTPVIFITAYDEYTLKAFKVNSVDYLLKPINKNDLTNSINKFHTYFHNNKNYLKELELIFKKLQPKTKERFLIKVGEHFRSILTSNINCFYIKERYTFILDNKGKNHPVDYSLEKIEQLIDPEIFFRVNRNFIINFYSIKDIIIYSSNRLKIILSDWTENDDILVSRERVVKFKEWMER